MTRLQDLHHQQGQSPWLDNLRRSWITSGELQRWIDRGVRGITSNPTIFAKAMTDTNDYDEGLASQVRSGATIDEAYWHLVVEDIRGALALLRPVYDASGGGDGFVSVEVSPALATDEAGTVAAARHLDSLIDGPNLLVKVPATREGVAAIETLIGEGRSINVTLIFSRVRYGEVIEAYLKGLERLAAADPRAKLGSVASVASFFVSRVDVEVDRRLDAIGSPDALALRGRAALAQAQLAYEQFRTAFSGPRWAALAARGAHVQRPLWASTSTKNPAYPDTLYVDHLIGPDTVNTLPDNTLDAFEDHGTVARTVDADLDGAARVIEALAGLGIDIEDVAHTLEVEGVAAFSKSFDDVLSTLTSRSEGLAGR